MDSRWDVPCAICGYEHPRVRSVERRSQRGNAAEWLTACCDGCGTVLGDFATEHMARKAWKVSNSVDVPADWRYEVDDEWWR